MTTSWMSGVEANRIILKKLTLISPVFLLLFLVVGCSSGGATVAKSTDVPNLDQQFDL